MKALVNKGITSFRNSYLYLIKTHLSQKMAEMHQYLDLIKTDYEKAEVTSLFLHNRETDKCYNLFSIAELIPAEQESSSLIGDENSFFLDRRSVDNTYTIYIGRSIDCKTDVGISFYRNITTGFKLEYGSILNRQIDLFDDAILEAEPSSEYPLVIDTESDHTLSNIMPHRHTNLRVWSKIDRSKKWLSQFNPNLKSKLLSKASQLTIRYLGFDISLIPEHLGSVYLCCCNPYLRKCDLSLLDYNQDLLVRFYERDGKTIIGKKLVLEDMRAGNIGFNLEVPILSINQRIQLPHFPDKLQTKIYDSNGFLLENHSGTWMNFSFQMQMQTAVVNLTVEEKNKTTTQEIRKFASEKPVMVGSYDHSLPHYLKSQQRNKEVDDLEARKEFIFFPGDDPVNDKEKARRIIGEILNRASKRCMILDPYFGAPDLFYVYIIKSTSIPIQILSSVAFLKKQINENSNLTHAEYLLTELKKFKKNIPQQKIECKVLKGNDKSPLHDRYIVIDDTVYLLGSSLNEFGTRATTLVKVPVPERIIDKAISWWDTDEKTTLLENYLTQKVSADES